MAKNRKSKAPKLKEYRVLVMERPHEFDGIMARSPEDAGARGVREVRKGFEIVRYLHTHYMANNPCKKEVRREASKFCVHVQEKEKHYENITAANSKEAIDRVVSAEYAGDWDGIAEVEVYLTCGVCGYDNDPKRRYCEECRAEI